MAVVESSKPILLVSPWPTRNNGLSNYAGRYKAALEQSGRRIETERLYFWGEKFSAWKWIHVLKRATQLQSTSILIQHTPTCSGPFLPWFLSRAHHRGMTTAVVSHETPETYARHLDKLPPLRRAYLDYERKVARRCSAFIVHTSIHEHQMRQLGAPVAEVIPHAILNMPERILRRAPETLALYGQIGRKKGHDLAIDAIQSREPGTFPILEIWGAPGVGQEAYLEDLRQRVQPEFAERILFRGYLPDETKAEAFARMRLALFPYRWISQSGAMAEAVAHSVPYLASDIPFFAEFQSAHGCGDLFPSDTAAHLAARMQEILSAPDRWTDTDFSRVHQNLSIESCSARLLKHL